MNEQMNNNPNTKISQSTSEVMKKTGVWGIRNALIVLNLVRSIGNTFGFAFILTPNLQNLGWNILLSSASQLGGWRLLNADTFYIVVNVIIGAEFLLSIVATVLLFLSLSRQRWGAAISVFAFGLDLFLWWRSGDTAIIGYLIDAAVIMIAVIHLVKLKKPLFSEAISPLRSPNRDVGEPDPFSYTAKRDLRPRD